MKTLTTYGASISPANIQYAISNSGLKWKMSPAQWTSIQYWALHNPTVITKKNTKEEVAEFFFNPVMTLFGIPAEIDTIMNQHFVDLYHNGELIFRIDGLAVPMGFPL
jgi:hypothetical protein